MIILNKIYMERGSTEWFVVMENELLCYGTLNE